jgi:hypothetical protein
MLQSPEQTFCAQCGAAAGDADPPADHLRFTDPTGTITARMVDSAA